MSYSRTSSDCKRLLQAGSAALWDRFPRLFPGSSVAALNLSQVAMVPALSHTVHLSKLVDSRTRDQPELTVRQH